MSVLQHKLLQTRDLRFNTKIAILLVPSENCRFIVSWRNLKSSWKLWKQKRKENNQQRSQIWKREIIWIGHRQKQVELSQPIGNTDFMALLILVTRTTNKDTVEERKETNQNSHKNSVQESREINQSRSRKANLKAGWVKPITMQNAH